MNVNYIVVRWHCLSALCLQYIVSKISLCMAVLLSIYFIEICQDTLIKSKALSKVLLAATLIAKILI